MSEAAVPPMIRQRELIEQIARTVVGSVTEPWSSVSYIVKSLAALTEDMVCVTRPGGGVERKFPPDELVDLGDELRAAMYRPGAGTWFSAILTVSSARGVDADFNYDDEPNWDAPVDPDLYVQDLQTYPRDEAARPEWLRQRLSEAFSAG